MKTSKRLFLIVALAVFLLAGAAGAAYAYWYGNIDGSNEDSDNINITISQGKNVTTTIDISDKSNTTIGKLVPQGVLADSNEGEVSEITYTFNVKWEDDASLTTGIVGILDVYFDDLKIGDADANNRTPEELADDFVIIEMTVGGTPFTVVDGMLDSQRPTITLDGDSVVVTVTVKLRKPTDVDEYNSIINKVISFKMYFSARLPLN